MNTTIYLDNAANTPVLPEVLSTYIHITQTYLGNPNASHFLGQQANQRFQEASQAIASILQANPTELIFTSGATEANNLAIKGYAYANRAYGKHIITSYLEHSSLTGALMALQEEGYEIEFVDVNQDGSVNIEHFAQLLRKDTILVSIAAIDSEIGAIQDLSSIYKLTKTLPHCKFHTDATQAIGKYHISYEHYDMMTCSPHKFHGLNGSGLLVAKEHVHLQPMLDGGISTTPYRSGTPVLAMACTLQVALQCAYQNNKLEEAKIYVRSLYHTLKDKLRTFTNVVINSPEHGSPYILNVSLKNMKAETFQNMLEEHNIILATKAACCAVNTPSRPVYAITKNRKLALSTLRISLSHMTTIEEIHRFLQAFELVYRELGG